MKRTTLKRKEIDNLNVLKDGKSCEDSCKEGGLNK